MKKVIIVSGSIYLTLIAIILIARFTNVYGLLIAVLAFIIMVSIITLYDLYIATLIQRVSYSIQETTEFDQIIKRVNDILKRPLTKDQSIRAQFLLVIAYTYMEGGLPQAEKLLANMEIPSKKAKYQIIKLDCLLAFDIIRENEESYFSHLQQEKKYIENKKLADNKVIMTYYFQLLKDFYQPSLEARVNEIIKNEREENLSVITEQFYCYLKLLKKSVNGMPLNGIDELKRCAKGTYLYQKIVDLENR